MFVLLYSIKVNIKKIVVTLEYWYGKNADEDSNYDDDDNNEDSKWANGNDVPNCHKLSLSKKK